MFPPLHIITVYVSCNAICSVSGFLNCLFGFDDFAGKKKRLTFIECNNDVNSMIDLAKVADLVSVASSLSAVSLKLH